MDRYITTTQLKQGLREAKEAAQSNVVHVLEHGRAAYVLCSVELYEDLLRDARARASWKVDVEYAAKESERDVAEGRTYGLGDVIEYAGGAGRPVRIASSAACELAEHGEGLCHAVAITLAEVAESPDHGMAIEYDGGPRGLRKVLVPPFDVLYSYDARCDQVMVRGVVRSLDA